jgi:hypothetical protein
LHFASKGAKNTSHWHNFIANNSSVQPSVDQSSLNPHIILLLSLVFINFVSFSKKYGGEKEVQAVFDTRE